MMNSTLPLIDINNNSSLIYKLFRVEDDPRYVCFEIAFIINDAQNI